MNNKQIKQLDSIGFVRISPSILGRGQIWFEQNKNNIKRESQKITSWWSLNYKIIEKDELIPMSNLMRQLSDWNYIKTQEVKNPGEFSNKGGLLDIFPPNLANAVRIEYLGNAILSIYKLDNVINKNPQRKLKELISKKPQLYTSKFTQKDSARAQHIENLRPGTYVVHTDHGIAKFKKIEKQKNINYIVLEYAHKDRLLVPMSIASKVSPYVGFGDPRLTRLGGNFWEKTKRKVKDDLLETAKQLAKIYAKREMAHRPPYNIDKELANSLKYSFQYEETADQKRTLKEIVDDMSGNIPMDRIICGDVGFGKTEIAIRTAAYVISCGYQVALISPTTILAHQHFKTFQKRFKESSIPINLKKLTRIEKPPEQKRILSALKSGGCDLVIGTHRLLQKDIEFSKLGMLIIDEEQRFGVKQKEMFKEKRENLDIISLSATPIPRTLHFALSGLRDLSTIMTAPSGRKPIETRINKFNKNLIKKAIENEIKRGGQIYYLHNRIYSLPKTVEMLQELVPKARIGYMHAKLSETELIKTLDLFSSGKIGVLVTTTIMENGLDVSNANTLIVEDATRLGLSQSHQIRGRIGRGTNQAIAYFLYPAHKLKPKAASRLKALADAQYLGAGYQIAMRDLELRGTGSFLGKEQSGNIAKVGFNLYCQLLNEAIEELKNNS